MQDFRRITINHQPKKFMGRIYNNIIETVGRTPLVKLHKVTASAGATFCSSPSFSIHWAR